MGLGDMLAGAMDAFGGTDEIISKTSKSGIDHSALAEVDPEAVTAMIEEKAINLSMLEGLGLSVEDVIEKFKEQLG
ncbi:hypothetical protein [Roseovarius sp. SYSU LYC5161]|uniref:hypothetical protein n=1 Tax=Roseovarius halophilus (ex Wu et al. 2025) TaxID=3376060 RepID=UPI00399AE952